MLQENLRSLGRALHAEPRFQAVFRSVFLTAYVTFEPFLQAVQRKRSERRLGTRLVHASWLEIDSQVRFQGQILRSHSHIFCEDWPIFEEQEFTMPQ